jgi:hypothetical protein
LQHQEIDGRKRCSANVEKGLECAKHCRIFQHQQIDGRLGFADIVMGQELKYEHLGRVWNARSITEFVSISID